MNCPCCRDGTVNTFFICDRCGVGLACGVRLPVITVGRTPSINRYTPREPNSYWDYIQTKKDK